MESPLYKCSQCGKEFSFENIRYSRDGKRIVCKNCYKSSMEYEQKFREEEMTDLARKKKEVIKIICMDCRYKFSLKKNSRIRPVCPYCGGSRLMKDEPDIDKLIREVSNYK